MNKQIIFENLANLFFCPLKKKKLRLESRALQITNLHTAFKRFHLKILEFLRVFLLIPVID